MKIILTFLLCFATPLPATAQPKQPPKSVLVARFEVTGNAFNFKPAPRQALLLYADATERNIESVRIHGTDKQTGALGTIASLRLMRRLEKLDLPNINYQKYFDKLAKQPRPPDKEWLIAADGNEVEVEMHITGTKVRFKMWNPDTFFINHDDDKIAVKVNAAVEAIILTLGKSSVYF